LVAPLTPAQQADVLGRAERDGLSAAEVRREVSKIRRQEALAALAGALPPPGTWETWRRNVRATLADCRAVLKDVIPPESVDLVLCDPPYGKVIDNFGTHTEPPRWQPMLNNDGPFTEWIALAARALKWGGCLVCFCEEDSLRAFREAIEAEKCLEVKRLLVWYKGGGSAFLGNPHGIPAHTTEYAWFAAKGQYEFADPDLRLTNHFAYPAPPGDALIHQTQKPVRLLWALINALAPPGGVVLDPCAGSFSTAAACVMASLESRCRSGLEYQCLAVEQDPIYYQAARKAFNDPLWYSFRLMGAPA
jgi:site-specific DNA-methyltransferase (adenine-specific)